MANFAAIDFTIALQALDIPDIVILKITEAHKICTAHDLANINLKHLGTLLHAKLSTPGTGSIICCPETDVLRIEALAYWLRKEHCIGRELYPVAFIDICNTWVDRMIEESDQKRDGTESKPTEPEKFKDPTKWATFHELFVVYLSLIPGSSGVPLAYVIHHSSEPDYSIRDKRAWLIACAPLHGQVFDYNNGIVYNHLKDLVLDGPGWAWIQQFDQQHDGCAAWLCLIGQYKGLVFFELPC